MRTASWSLTVKFIGVVDHMIAALHQQREIEARRILQRYGHLLDVRPETSPLNQFISAFSEKEFAEHAHQSDAREHSARHPHLEHA